jgi:phage terminase Nu1 subunit (DNA packaging protein)
VFLFSILEWAFQFGVSEHTLARRLKGIDSPDGKYSAAQVHSALADDARASRTRLATARAKLAELDLKVKQQDLFDGEETARFIIGTFGPIRSMIVSMPGQLTHLLVNQDAASIRQHLDQYRDEFLRAAKANVEQKFEDADYCKGKGFTYDAQGNLIPYP